MKHILDDVLKSPQFLEGNAWQRQKYKPNEVVIKEGDIGSSLFFVEQGLLRVTGRVNLGEKKHIQPGIGDLKAGALFGESCLRTELPRIATVTTVTDVILLEINGEKFSVFLDANPIQGYLFYKGLFEVLIGRLKSANHTIETLMAWGLKVREIDRYL